MSERIAMFDGLSIGPDEDGSGLPADVRTMLDKSASVQDIFAASIGLRCSGCRQPATTEIRIFSPADEAVKRWPVTCARIMASTETGALPTVMFKGAGGRGIPHVLVSRIGCCALCRKTAIKAAAKGPSWLVVEVDDGPKDRAQVGAGSRP